jgi:hypothetical protein
MGPVQRKVRKSELINSSEITVEGQTGLHKIRGRFALVPGEIFYWNRETQVLSDIPSF